METKLPQQPKHRKVLAIGDLMAQMRVAWESIRAQREGIRALDAISKPNQRMVQEVLALQEEPELYIAKQDGGLCRVLRFELAAAA